VKVLHPICTSCFWAQSYDAPPDPERPRPIREELCCACHRPTRAGLYVEAPAEALPCVGHGHPRREVRT
jgi:hypothetical protein